MGKKVLEQTWKKYKIWTSGEMRRSFLIPHSPGILHTLLIAFLSPAWAPFLSCPLKVGATRVPVSSKCSFHCSHTFWAISLAPMVPTNYKLDTAPNLQLPFTLFLWHVSWMSHCTSNTACPRQNLLSSPKSFLSVEPVTEGIIFFFSHYIQSST